MMLMPLLFIFIIFAFLLAIWNDFWDMFWQMVHLFKFEIFPEISKDIQDVWNAKREVENE